MATQIGVGFSNKTDSFVAGQEAAAKALPKIGSVKPNLVLTFCSGKHNPGQFLAGVRSVTHETPLLGGAAMGVFTNDQLSYEEFEGTVTLFCSDSIQFRIFSQPDLDKDEGAAGAGLARQIKAASSTKDKGLLVFYDSVKSANPSRFNFASVLFEAIEKIIDPALPVAGGGMIGDFQLMQCFQFINDKVVSQHVLALLISGDCQMHSTVIHGCQPASSYKTITRVEGPVIYEIDNRPALDVIKELFVGKKVSWDDYPFFVTLGINQKDKYGTFTPENYINRLCLAIEKEKKALVMIEPDFKAGDEVQIMLINIDLEYIQREMIALEKITTNHKPIYYFYIDCIGRAKPSAGGEWEDAEEVQRIIPKDVPLMGYYSGGEIAKVQNKIRSMVWTGVMCVLTE